MTRKSDPTPNRQARLELLVKARLAKLRAEFERIKSRYPDALADTDVMLPFPHCQPVGEWLELLSQDLDDDGYKHGVLGSALLSGNAKHVRQEIMLIQQQIDFLLAYCLGVEAKEDLDRITDEEIPPKLWPQRRDPVLQERARMRMWLTPGVLAGQIKMLP